MFYKIFFSVMMNCIFWLPLFAQEDSAQLARDALEQSVMTQDQLNNFKADIKSHLDNISNQNIAMKSNAEIAYKKAQNLSSIGQIKDALIYYLIATYTDKTEPKYLTTYFRTVLISADNLAERGNIENAYNRLLDLETFMMNSFDILSLQKSDDVLKLFNDIDIKKQIYTQIIKERDIKVATDNLNILLTEADNLLKIQIPEQIENLTQYIKQIESIATAIMRYNNISDNPKVSQTIKELSEKLLITKNIFEIEKLILNADTILQTSMIKKDNNSITQRISEVTYINQRLNILSNYATIRQKNAISKLTENFANEVTLINKELSAKEFDRLKNRYNAVTKSLIKNKTNSELALKNLYLLQDEIIVDSSKITDTSYLKEIRSLLNDLSKEIISWQEFQLRAYDRFAIDNIKQFYNLYSKELGILGSGRDTKQKIFLGLIDYLCPIEVRYLSSTGSKIYSDVFDFFYKELDRDQRIDLASKFLDCDKKPLNSF